MVRNINTFIVIGTCQSIPETDSDRTESGRNRSVAITINCSDDPEGRSPPAEVIEQQLTAPKGHSMAAQTGKAVPPVGEEKQEI
jgi:hypothetical protein